MSFKIMIVDDSAPMRSVIKKTIKASGFGQAEYFEANNGKEALKILQDNWLDIVVTDYNMPNMNGLELIDEMKKDNIMSSIPVLVVTTEGSQHKMEQFLEHGAGYIKKPFTPEMIKQKLLELLGESEYEESFEEGDEDLDF